MDKILERILPNVSKPARYTGGEWNSIVKDWEGCDVRWALAFPDIYDLAMSNHGLSILYDRLNSADGVLAERVFAPWVDMEEAMRAAHLPLFSLESHRPLADFDVIGFSVPYEQLFTNVLNMLDLAGLPVLARERGEGHPLVLAGGGAVYNPEPLADFVDAFAIGEGEEIIFDVSAAVREAKRDAQQRPLSRDALLRRLARIPGIYVPGLYDVRYADDGTIAEVRPTTPEAAMPVRKRIAVTLPPPVTRPIVPYVDTVHNRGAIEIQRGCGRGCRFCHAGMTYRPLRERPVDEILAAVDEMVAETGYEEIALLSLSSSDYHDIEGLVAALAERYAGRRLSISLPSLRIESVSVALMDQIQETSRRSSYTFAPEAGTERLRGVINKPIADEDLLSVAAEVYGHGWKTIKLYFMIGHPTQTLEDVAAIVDLAMQVRDVGRRILGRKAQVNVGVSTLVPKPHTPFQWVPLASEDDVHAQQEYLKEHLRGPGLKLNWNSYQLTLLEAVLSRGDRRLGAVIHRAWQLGARFDAWGDQFKVEAWRQAFREAEVDVGFYAWRERSLDEGLPWDHIDSGVSKRFLARDYQASLRAETHLDCREQCHACGILAAFRDECADLPVDAWVCPTPRSKE